MGTQIQGTKGKVQQLKSVRVNGKPVLKRATETRCYQCNYCPAKRKRPRTVAGLFEDDRLQFSFWLRLGVCGEGW